MMTMENRVGGVVGHEIDLRLGIARLKCRSNGCYTSAPPSQSGVTDVLGFRFFATISCRDRRRHVNHPGMI